MKCIITYQNTNVNKGSLGKYFYNNDLKVIVHSDTFYHLPFIESSDVCCVIIEPFVHLPLTFFMHHTALKKIILDKIV